MAKKIKLALIADSNYAIPAAVTLRSAINHNRGKIGELYLFSTCFNKEDLSALESICKEDGIGFNLVSIDESVLDPYDGLSAWSKYTFIKILIPELLDIDDMLLYMDVDMLVTGDLSGVYNIDMEGNALSAVPDLPVVREDNRRCGLPDGNNYINSGFMLMDMAKWKQAWKAGLFEKAIEHLKSMRPPFINDQDVINTVFPGACQPLPLRYNVTNQSFGLHSLYCQEEYRKGWRESRKDPAVIHFTSSRRPWKPDVFHPYKREWFRTLDQTPFRKRIPYCRLTVASVQSWCITEAGMVADWFRMFDRP